LKRLEPDQSKPRKRKIDPAALFVGQAGAAFRYAKLPPHMVEAFSAT